MDELFGDVTGSGLARCARSRASRRGSTSTTAAAGDARPRVRGVVKVELAGVPMTPSTSRSPGRELVISGERPVQETEGRVYQQVEIEAGPFRRLVELNADVVAEERPGDLRRRHPPGRAAAQRPARAPAGSRSSRGSDDGRGDALDRGRRDARHRAGDPRPLGQKLPGALPVLPLKDMVTFPDTLTPLAVGQPAFDPADRRRPLGRADGRDGRLARPGPRRARPRRHLRRRRRRRGRPDAEDPRRHRPRSRPGRRAGPDRRLRHRGPLPDRPHLLAARRGRAVGRARGADPQRPDDLQRDHRADPLPPGGAAARGHQPRRPVGAQPRDRRRRCGSPPRRSRSCSRRSTSTAGCAGCPRSSPASSR